MFKKIDGKAVGDIFKSIPDEHALGFVKSEQWQEICKNGTEKERKTFMKMWHKKYGAEQRLKEEFTYDFIVKKVEDSNPNYPALLRIVHKLNTDKYEQLVKEGVTTLNGKKVKYFNGKIRI